MRGALVILIFSMVVRGQVNEIPSGSVLQELIVTVRDEKGHLVQNLTARDFRIEQDGMLQSIELFSPDTKVPVSIGLLLDTRLSMLVLTDINKEIGALRILLNSTARDGDEFALMTFADSLKILEPFTRETARVDRTMYALYPTDLTKAPHVQPLPLFEAIRRALEEMRRSKYPKRALVIATEAYAEKDLNTILQEIRSAELPIFIFGFGGANIQITPVRSDAILSAQTWERMELLKAKAIEETLTAIANESGGRSEMFLLDQSNPVDRVVRFSEELATELRGQYLLGFFAENSNLAQHVIRVKTNSVNYNVSFHRVPLAN